MRGRNGMEMDRIKRAMVIGAGTMGHSIAMVFAQGGYEVDLVDLTEAILGKALSLIQSNLRTLGKARLIDSRSIPQVLDRIHTSTSLGVAKRADLVVETIREDPEAKRRLLHSLDRICPPRTILTSNTSYLNIFKHCKNGSSEKTIDRPLVGSSPPYSPCRCCKRSENFGGNGGDSKEGPFEIGEESPWS